MTLLSREVLSCMINWCPPQIISFVCPCYTPCRSHPTIISAIPGLSFGHFRTKIRLSFVATGLLVILSFSPFPVFFFWEFPICPSYFLSFPFQNLWTCIVPRSTSPSPATNMNITLLGHLFSIFITSPRHGNSSLTNSFENWSDCRREHHSPYWFWSGDSSKQNIFLVVSITAERMLWKRQQ